MSVKGGFTELKEGGSTVLFSTRQAHLLHTAFGFPSSSSRGFKIVRLVRFHPSNGHQLPPFEGTERTEWWVQGTFSEPSKRTKLQKNVIHADALLTGPSHAIPWVSFPFAAPWSPAPPDQPCPLLLLPDGPTGPLPWVLPLSPALVMRTGKASSEELVALCRLCHFKFTTQS